MKKKDNSSKKNRKIGQRKILCHDTISECHDGITTEPAKECRKQHLFVAIKVKLSAS